MTRRHLALAALLAALSQPIAFAVQDGATPTVQGPAPIDVAAPIDLAPPAAPAAGDDTPVIDRSDWPALAPVVISGDALQRASAAIAPYPFAEIAIDEAELRRTIVYMIGAKELRSFRLDIDLDAEMQRQIANGRDPAEFTIAEEDIQHTIDQSIEQIKAQYPTLDPEDVLRVNNIHIGNLMRMTRQTRLFTTVFLPDDPSMWPPVTVEAIRSAGQGVFLEQLKSSFDNVQARISSGELSPEDADKARQGQQTMRQLMAQVVIQALDKATIVESAGDGLPSSIVLRVNGRDLLTDVVYDEIASRVTPRDIELAQRWLVKCELVRRVLATRGQLLDEVQAAAAFEEHMAPMTGTMFPPEFFVVQVKGFPSMDLYEVHHRLLASYERMIAAEITEAELERHFRERGNQLLNVARVGTEVILLSAFDFSKGKWKENGWADAEQRAREVGEKLLQGNGANWSELQDQYSDFWDPPAPTTPVQGQQPKRKNKGRFAPMSRNELLGELGENEFSLFIDGTSVTDELFFYTGEGQVGGPFKGRLGYYIGRVTTRTVPQGNRELTDPDMRSMVVQDYVNERFNAFAREVYDAAMAAN